MKMADEKCNKIYKYLYEKHDYCTKEELMYLVGISSERTIRDLISKISMKAPIISTSDRKGYKLARKVGDLEEVEHAWKEIDSRIEELEKKRKPLIKFREKALEIKNNISEV